MNKARRRKKSIAWARYTNHYAYMLYVGVGGWGFVRSLNTPGRYWMYIRRQQKRAFEWKEVQ